VQSGIADHSILKRKGDRMRAVTLTVLSLALTGIVAAQQPAFKRTVLQQADISVPGREVVSAVAEFDPRATPGMHTHFGEEIGYVIEGTFLIEQAGKPPVTLQAGGSFLIPAGTVHNATNTGAGKGRILATYIVEKGKPLATPAK
jgi:quercetin dioxygenase-like cupin family protein